MTGLGVVAVGCAGALGALLRFAVDSLIAVASSGRFGPGRRSHWPWATLLVNIGGSLGIGLATGLLHRAVLDPFWYQALGAGLAGGLTTFSSFTVATVLLWQEGHRFWAGLNLLANLALGFAAAAAGLTLSS